MRGQVISGEFGRIMLRQKAGEEMEIGELLVAEHEGSKMLLQVCDLRYGSQLSQGNIELMSGLLMEEDTDLEVMDSHLRNYSLAVAKTLLTINGAESSVSKTLPRFLSKVRQVNAGDIHFISQPKKPIHMGKLRSGSRAIDLDVNLDGEKVLSEHVLIAATTGRGKSNLTSCLLWDAMPKDYCGILVLDPHDEYYGRNTIGLKEHPCGNVSYYSSNPPPGCKSLKINLQSIRPQHFNGCMPWSDAQKEAMAACYRKFGKDWIEKTLTEDIKEFHEATLNVVRRRLLSLLSIDESLRGDGAFDAQKGAATISNICDELEAGKVVVVDTSSFTGATEILVGTLITTEVFRRYRKYKISGTAGKPSISIVLEEAPRVLGKEVLEKGSNIFATIAREGRKFKVGLIAITQLPSLIPRQILANMNTKIILGIEMAPERQAIIESASQDLSDDSRSIAALDKGEAIVSSNFSRFALPVKIPLFKDVVTRTQNEHVKEKYIKKYNGVVTDGPSKTS